MAFTGHVFASSFADTHGYSAKGIGMGNAMTAIVDDWSSVYYNMAGLGKTKQLKGSADGQKGGSDSGMGLKKKGAKEATSAVSSESKALLNEVYLGFMYTLPMLSINENKSISTLDVVGDKDLGYSIITLGVALDLNIFVSMPSFISSARLGIGLGTPADGSVAKVNDINLDTHDFIRYGREAQMAKIMVGLGFGFLDDLFGVGVGVNASFAGKGSMIMGDVNITNDEQTPLAETKMDLAISPSMVAGVYVNPGKLLSILQGLEFGASYRQETAMEIKPFNAAAVVPATMNMSLSLAISDYYAPHTVTAGVAYNILGMVLVSADVEVQLWKYYKVSPVMNYLYASQLPDANNVIMPKLGVKYDPLSWLSVMAGASYRTAIFDAKEMSGDVDLLDGPTISASVGLGFKLPSLPGLKGNVDIIVAYQYQYMLETSVKKDTEEALEPNYTFGGMCHAVSMGLSLHI
ncbi:MAG: hypothetical protein CVV44_21550 [Spirochaetae bacterium HGW-Spirochaetae-1]|nr:MAG: hypothetical protein CVV44_21550 [Spirochaetae bacterium HGW-Spirochaetae-1]